MGSDARHHLLLGIAVAALAAACFASSVHPTQAVISPSPCPGNVCTGTVVVGGQSVVYAYTQHLSSNGQFRIRLNGGVYNTGGLVSMIIHDMPVFSTWDKLANPTNGAVYLPVENVNLGHTAYERRDPDGCVSCIVDQVMSVTYAGLPAGSYTFDLTIIQNGDSGGRVNLPFFVDAGAPSNGNESTAWAAISGMDYPCADTFDNDIDFYADCADVQCNGQVGKVSTGALCQIPESTCNDEFDNDADGLTDCLDPSCDGLVGQPAGTALCQYGNEYGASTCGDNFDNDGDSWTDCLDNVFNAGAGGNANTICWKKPAYGCPAVENCATPQDDDKDKSYDDAWDAQPLTGVNCQDYDCAGHPSCPAQENKTAAGVDADAQCFNGIDDDLDHDIDCGDQDCRGIVNPGNTAQICYEKEFDLGQRYQFCGNVFDDDGDGPQDCDDPDCTRRFGNCGPCPSREDYTYDACSDAYDNDTDVVADCADTDCAGNLGWLSHAANCAAAENTNDLCGDRADNDLDTAADCADPGCAGRIGPVGQTCQLSESACADQADNDGDGKVDCADSGCAGIGSCAPKNWTESACQIVPSYSAPTVFTSNDPTITATVRTKTHVSSVDTVRFVGTGTYSSITIILGDNTDPLLYYPYADNGPNCTLLDTVSGLPPARLAFLAIVGHAVQIYNTPGPDIAGFDVTFTCVTPATPAAQKDYPISISVLKEPGGVAEYGDVDFSTTLYEATAPSVLEVEPEGEMAGTIKVPYGAIVGVPGNRFRGVPNDPGVGLASSGICRCVIKVAGTDHDTVADCLTAPVTFTLDQNIAVQGRAEDGAGNLGAFSAVQNFAVNVVPTVSEPLAVAPTKPFFKTGAMAIDLFAEFLTGTSDTFNPACDVYVRDVSGNIVNGPIGPTFSFVGMPAGPFIRCEAVGATLPAMPDGTYYVTVKARDSDGDAAETNRKVMYMCNDVPAAGDPDPGNGCAYADFDRDGAVEGLYTTLYSTAPKACDNCIGLSNATQVDANANGVGDICEPNDQYGRCEIDTEIVCSWDSDDPVHCEPTDGPLCCPGPSIGLDYSVPGPPYFPKDPQECKEAWGLCTLGGEVCFEDADCPGGPGLCQDGLTSCYRDADCTLVSGTPLCAGADRCENLLFPWLQTVFGNIFSKKKITAPDLPPQGQFNAQFCITAKDTIFNVTTAGQGGCTAQTDPTVKFERPKSANVYSTVLGRLDLAGLRSGKYGTVETVSAAALNGAIDSSPDRLNGKVFRVVGDATLSAHTIYNSGTNGAGTILIDGGNLTITGDIQYDNASVTQLTHLASLGIIVVPDGAGAKGNIYVDPAVTVVSAAIYAGGDDGFWTVDPAIAADSPAPFTVYGLAIARQFHLSRSYKSLTQGSERFIYDGRAVVNPPPGFADITKALPIFRDTAAQ